MSNKKLEKCVCPSLPLLCFSSTSIRSLFCHFMHIPLILYLEKNEAVKRHAFSDYLIRLKQVEIACADSREIPPGG